MSRWVKIGGIAVGTLVVVLVVVFMFLLSSLDGLIEAAVEKFGSEATRTRVTLNNVDISPTSGTGTMSGLFVGNPKGYKTKSAFELGSISVKIDISTITSDVILIKEIVITKPVVTYELGPGGNNIDVIKKNVNAYAGAERKQQKGKGKSAGDGGGGKKLIIEHLYIRGGTVNVSSAMLKGKKLSSGLPTIHLRNIGKKKGGASPGEVVEKIIGSISRSVTKSVSSLGIGKALKEGASGVGSKVKGLFK
ncbi:MAG: hypothetical protein V3S44_09220 [Alphaproteobacteria bacterium]